MRTAESVLLTCWPPAPGSAVGVDPQVVLVDLDGALLGQERRDDHLREGRVPAVGAVERAQADEPVDAALGLEEAVGVLALRRERRRLEAGLLPRARLDQLRLEAAILCPAEVHAQEHLRPVLSVGAARARMNGDDGVTGVVLAVEERVLLEPLELAPDRLQLRLDVAGELGLELEQLGGVVVLALEPLVALEALREAGVLGRDGGRAGLVVPEARLPQLLLELGDAGCYGIRVKGNHEPRRAGL